MTDRIEPFSISVDGAALADLRDRLRRTRRPEREPVGDWSKGQPRTSSQMRAPGRPT